MRGYSEASSRWLIKIRNFIKPRVSQPVHSDGHFGRGIVTHGDSSNVFLFEFSSKTLSVHGQAPMRRRELLRILGAANCPPRRLRSSRRKLHAIYLDSRSPESPTPLSKIQLLLSAVWATERKSERVTTKLIPTGIQWNPYEDQRDSRARYRANCRYAAQALLLQNRPLAG